MAAPRPGSAVSAWNDPPLFSYDSTSAAQQSKGGKLNKRVAFPACTRTSDAALMPPSDPPSAATLLPPSAPLVCRPLVHQEEERPAQDALHQVLSVLSALLHKCSATLEKRTLEDVEKKLHVLESMWEDGKISPDVQRKMLLLSNALSRGDFQEANHVHMGLMVDHMSTCVSWMVGVKHLIHQGSAAAAQPHAD